MFEIAALLMNNYSGLVMLPSTVTVAVDTFVHLLSYQVSFSSSNSKMTTNSAFYISVGPTVDIRINNTVKEL